MATLQLPIDFTVKPLRQNTPQNQKHFDCNKEQLGSQMKKAHDLFKKGIVLSSLTAPAHGIADIRSIVRHLINAGVNVQKRWVLDEKGERTRFKEYFINKQ
jgi:hypothetical protein